MEASAPALKRSGPQSGRGMVLGASIVLAVVLAGVGYAATHQSLQVSSNPDKATIRLDGKVLGVTPTRLPKRLRP